MVTDNFSLDRILTVSAADYCGSVGRPLGIYELRGVHFEGVQTRSLEDLGIARQFSEVVPRDAEVVEVQVVPHLQLVSALDPEECFQQSLVQPDNVAEAEFPQVCVSLEELPILTLKLPGSSIHVFLFGSK